MKKRNLNKNEAIFCLSKKYFQYSKNQRSWIFLFLFLSIFAPIIMLSGPLIFGRMISELQFNAVSQKSLYTVIIFMGLLLIKDFVFWLFHGPSRILERIMAFKIETAYRKYLLEGEHCSF